MMIILVGQQLEPLYQVMLEFTVFFEKLIGLT